LGYQARSPNRSAIHTSVRSRFYFFVFALFAPVRVHARALIKCCYIYNPSDLKAEVR